MIKTPWLCMWLVACADPATPSEEPSSGTLVRASTGGVVALGDVTLVVPPNSLSEDTTISIEPMGEVPVVDSDGFAVLGSGFKFSPPGTQFSLERPAVLTMPYDAASLTNQGLDGRTLQLGYFDEDLGRYFSIGGELDPATGLVTARVEHFTLYVAMAATLLPGNNAPTIALQSPIPAALRANAPVYLRATVRDYDVGGSIASVRLHYRSDATGSFVELAMKPEATLDTFAALIPAAHVVADGDAIDLEYFVTAADNLGATRTSTTTNVDIARAYAPGTLVMSPATPAIAAGFERTFAVQGRDELNTLFALVPEIASSDAIGDTRIGTTGVTFRATTVGAGTVTTGFGAESASLPVTVFNGALDHIAILDKFGLPFEGTLVMDEGKHIQFDAVGFDAFENHIIVNPTWGSDTNIGGVVGAGLFDTLDGIGGGGVTATVGDITGTQSVYVNPRQFNTSTLLFGSTYLPRLATVGDTTYAVVADNGTWRVARRVGAGPWTDVGAPVSAPNLLSLAIGAGTSRVQVAWYDLNQLYSAHLEGDDWVMDGGNLVVDPDTTNILGYQPRALSLAFNGDTPYLGSWEQNAAGNHVFVRHWNGSSWVLDGGSIANGIAEDPSIAFLDGVPYIALTRLGGIGGADVLVYRFDGTAWQQLGAELGFIDSQPAIAPTMKNIGGRLTVSFLEPVSPGRFDLHVRQWNGSSWATLMHGIANLFQVRDHDLTADGDVPYIVWTETPSDNSFINRRVAHYNARIDFWGSMGSWNETINTDAMACAITVTNGSVYSAARENFGGGSLPTRISELH